MILGIRHHGPGSARSVRQALEAMAPDVVLIEGPPDADGILPIAAHPDMEPPVAILVYAVDAPEDAVFYPFAVFSPEWQALHYALERSIPVRFVDLPQSHRMAMRASRRRRPDPLMLLAQAAGYADGERWWESLVEQRRDSREVFEAILSAMQTVREAAPETDPIDLCREAFMRQGMRQAEREGFSRIAMVCGAWHAPALATMPTRRADDALTRGLPRRKVQATWVPWTADRLAFESGYGAGVESPGWYHHLFTTTHDPAVGWMSRVSRTLAESGLEASPAQAVDAARLAVALATLRDRPAAGLLEMNDAARAVFCLDNDLPMQLIRDRLIVGQAMGRVPEETPQVPLAADLRAEQKRLRLPTESRVRKLELDLRRERDREKSVLLHRVALMGIPWGQVEEQSGKLGTFHETWALRWTPELAVSLIDRSVWGSTVPFAAAAFAAHRAAAAKSLEELADLLGEALDAELSETAAVVVERLGNEAAQGSDTAALMGVAPPLARIARYGNVRHTDSEAVRHVVEGLLVRISLGLPEACRNLAEDPAREMLSDLMQVDRAVRLVHPDGFPLWLEALQQVVEEPPGLVPGRVARMLFDRGVWTAPETARRMGLALSPALPPSQSAAWAEGFLSASGALLIHDAALRELLDSWVTALPEPSFMELLPLLRRTFATFEESERRQLGEQLAQGASRELELDETRAVAVLPVVKRLLGLP